MRILILSKILLIIYVIFILNIFCQKIINKETPAWQISLNKFKNELLKQILRYSNSTMINETVFDNYECNNKFMSIFTHSSFLIDILQYSGKSLMDVGNQEDCQEDPENRYIYLFLKIIFDKKKLLINAKHTANDILLFTDQDTFFMGICLWKECKEFYYKFFDKTKNKKMHQFLYQTYKVKDLSIQKNPNLMNYNEINLGFYILIYATLFYLILRFIILLIGNIIVFIENKQIESSELESQKNRPTLQTRESEFLLVEEDKDRVNSKEKIKYINTNKYPYQNESVSISSSSSISSDYLSKVWSNKDAYDKEIKNCISDIKKSKNYKKFCDQDEDQTNLYTKNQKINEIRDTDIEFTLIASPKVTLCSSKQSLNLKQKFLNLTKTLSISQSFQCLFNVKNELYDDSNLEVISGIRSILLFWITVERLIVYVYSLSYDIGNISFYSSWGFVLIKYACFAVESTILLDGLLYSYKLMSFLKRSDDYSFKNFMRFFFNIIQRVILFTLIFFIITVNLDQTANILKKNHKTYIFSYLNELLVKEKCIENPFTILIPFYLQYYKCEETDYDNCLKYVFHCVNECYCMFFTVVLYYFLFKFRSKKFENFLISIIFLNTVFSFIYYTDLFRGINDSTYKFYNITFILGEVRLLKQPHLLYSVFFIGNNIGLIYYYYIDSIRDAAKYHKENIYIPFDYNFSIMKKINKLSNTNLYFIGFIALLFQILICCSYNFMLILKNEPDNLLLEFNFLNIFVFLYEKKINIILFAIITLVLLFSNDKFFLIYLLKSRIFITFSRISFPFICLDIFVNLFFTMIDIKIYWNHQNIFIISFAIYCVLIFLNFLLSILFELPVRVVYKKYIRMRVSNVIKL